MKKPNKKPCPFCGSMNLVETTAHPGIYIECLSCRANGRACHDASSAIDAWNLRDTRLVKPCPFCSGVDYNVQQYEDGNQITCCRCSCSGPISATIGIAVEKWNAKR